MKSLRKAIQKMDPNLSTEDEGFKIALVLLAAAEVGVNAERIAKRATLPRAVTRGLVAKCRRAGIFVKNRIEHGGWFDKTSGGIAFWMDVACVRGLLKRV